MNAPDHRTEEQQCQCANCKLWTVVYDDVARWLHEGADMNAPLSEEEMMKAAGFEWEPTDAGYPRWTYRSKDIFCVRPSHVSDQEWEERKKKMVAQSQLNMPPSFFAQLGTPCCSRWMKSELECIALAYVRALANDGDTWKRLSREQTYALLTDEQKNAVHGILTDDFYDHWFQSVSNQITDSDGAFGVGGFWHRGRA